jgi:hypothetical protein
MLGWLKKTKPEPLTGAPEVRRQKTYSAQSGHVYQYFYKGRRPAVRDRERGAEFVFDVSADRKTSFPVSVFVGESAIASWQQGHDRELNSTERYAIAKMALFQAFDERETPAQMKEEVRVRAADLEGILDTLGVD